MLELPKLSSRVLATSEFMHAATLVESEWGQEYSQRFIKESVCNATIEGSATYGLVTHSGRVVATGTVVKSSIDYALWGITWVVVDPSFRGQGVGSEMIRTLIKHARERRGMFPSKSTVVELTTSKPDYYTRFGFQSVAQWGEENKSTLMILDLRHREP